MQFKQLFGSLSRPQRITLIIFAAFTALVLVTLVVLLLTDQPPEPLAQLATPDNSVQCEENTALSLRQRGVAASVTITNQIILVNVVGPSAGAWDVYSATVNLAQSGCGPYNLVRVDIADPEGRPNVRVVLELTGRELQYWAEGVLNDAQLAERMRRQLYQTTSPATLTPQAPSETPTP